jgi:hypothetical protein
MREALLGSGALDDWSCAIFKSFIQVFLWLADHVWR